MQSQASTNTRDNKLTCQFLGPLTFWKRSTSRQRYHYSKRISIILAVTNTRACRETSTTLLGRNERAISNQSCKRDKSTSCKQRQDRTKQQDSKTSFRQQKSISTTTPNLPNARTTSSGLRTPFNSSTGRHQAVRTTEYIGGAINKEHRHNNGSPPRPRLLETLQLRSPPRRRSTSKRKVRTSPIPSIPSTAQTNTPPLTDRKPPGSTQPAAKNATPTSAHA